MRLLVCVKQVPDLTWGRPDSQEGLSFPQETPPCLDGCSGYALEAAARIQDALPDVSITALSLEGEEALRICLSVAADRAILLSDPLFNGVDSLTKGRILARAAEVLEAQDGPFDLILCGQQSADEASGQTGPALAHALGRPLISQVFTATPQEKSLIVTRQTGAGVQTVETTAPAVALCTKPDWDLRYPTILKKMLANNAEIPVLSARELSLSGSDVEDSRIQVLRRFAPRQKEGSVRISGSGADAARELLSLLEQARAL